nr:histone H4 transcription factor [Ciona intestinalis]|eukprot:XP_002121903.3 histone H4 transcription factor [Ciona intestinalis]
MSTPIKTAHKCVKFQPLQLRCEWNGCQVILADLSQFYEHLSNHFYALTPENSLSCKWDNCTFVCQNGVDLFRHLNFHGYHTKIKWWGLLCHQEIQLGECHNPNNRNMIPELPHSFKCQWSDCSMVFENADQFFIHVYDHAVLSEKEVLENGKIVFSCHWTGCKYYYDTQGKTSACVARSKLKDHTRSHTKEKCYACPWCGNLYVNKTKFTDHFDRQAAEETHSFQCTHCSRTFLTERILKDHMRQHVNHYKCPKCEMTCPNPSSLKHHIRYKHSDERPYACSYCPYKSKEPYDLQVHATFHRNDLLYKCHVKDCDYVVRSLQNLRYHYRTKHTDGKSKCYACHLCDNRQNTGFNLTNHLRSVHNFHWPPGHSRFKYKECDDGCFRLQTFRFESDQLTEHQTNDNPHSSSSCSLVSYAEKEGNSEIDLNNGKRQNSNVSDSLNNIEEEFLCDSDVQPSRKSRRLESYLSDCNLQK